MGVEHVDAGVLVAEFQDGALGLSLDDGVGVVARGELRARGIVIEEISMQVKRIHQIEF